MSQQIQDLNKALSDTLEQILQLQQKAIVLEKIIRLSTAIPCPCGQLQYEVHKCECFTQHKCDRCGQKSLKVTED